MPGDWGLIVASRLIPPAPDNSRCHTFSMDSDLLVTVATEIINKKLTEAISGIAAALAKATKYDQRRMASALQQYATEQSVYVSRTKTILNPDHLRDVCSIVEAPHLRSGDGAVGKATWATLEKRSSFLMLSGTAGAGKSTILRSIYLEACQDGGRLPVFIELRHLNNTEETLLSYLMRQIGVEVDISREAAIKMLRSLHLLLLVDAFDELQPDKRDVVKAELFDLAVPSGKSSQPNRLRIVLSTRPDLSHSGWRFLEILHLMPLDIQQMRSLITKVGGDHSYVSRFIEQLADDTFFKRYSDFLGIPLLLILMLLMYKRNVAIPEKLHLFYEFAFDTLVLRHDSSSKDYTRVFRTGLDIRQFRDVLAAFSIRTHFKYVHEFSLADLHVELDVAQKICGLNSDGDDLIYDLATNICVIQQDGLVYTFTHRSFQEYFAAYFFAEMRFFNLRQGILSKFTLNSRNESILRMLSMLNQRLFEDEWLFPQLASLLNFLGITKNLITDYGLSDEKLKSSIPDRSCDLIRNVLVYRMSLDSERFWEVSNTDQARLVLFIMNLYDIKLDDPTETEKRVRRICKELLGIGWRTAELQDICAVAQARKQLVDHEQCGRPMVLVLLKLARDLRRRFEEDQRYGGALLMDVDRSKHR